MENTENTGTSPNDEKKRLAEIYLGRVKGCLKGVKILFCVIMAVAAAFAVFAIAAFASGMRESNRLGLLIGCGVFAGVAALLVITLAAVYLYAYISLKKLKKLGEKDLK